MAQYGFSYLQSVTKNLALGVDFLYLGRPPYPGAPPFSSLTAGLLYSTARLATHLACVHVQTYACVYVCVRECTHTRTHAQTD